VLCARGAPERFALGRITILCGCLLFFNTVATPRYQSGAFHLCERNLVAETDRTRGWRVGRDHQGRDPDAAVVLLCNVRALLKKMQQKVLVGDRVQLVGVDWVAERGEPTPVCRRVIVSSSSPWRNFSIQRC
jgi:hypothetical protein